MGGKNFNVIKIILRKIILRTCISLFCLLLTACTPVGPNFHPPCPPPVKHYTPCPLPEKTVCSPVHGGETQYYIHCADIPAQWWHVFHSPALNTLICRGIANSPNLAAAEAALTEAQQNLQAAIGSILLPSVDANFSAVRQRFSLATIGAPNNTTTVFNLFDATLNVSYTLDVFGGGRRQIQAFGALVEYQNFLKEAAYLTLTSNIVTTSIAEASFREQIKAVNELIRIEESLLTLTKKRFNLGAASGANVLAQQTQLAQTRALLPPLVKNLAETRHALAVLVGGFPCEAACLPCFELCDLVLPKELPVSIPSLLVCQRPDVRASQALLEQATALIGVAIANMLPKFPLTATYGSEANRIPDLFLDRTGIWSIGAQVIQPIFHGGALNAQRKAAIAAAKKACAEYKETVLKAFQSVADVLRALELDALTLRAQVAAENSAKASLRMTQKQFLLGGVSYIDVLNAQRQYEQTLINRIQAQAARFNDTVALFQALGGGWWNRPCPCECKPESLF